MLEREPKIARTRLQSLRFVDVPAILEDFSGFKLRDGHSKKYRGNHRSHVRGKGIFANFRKKGMKSFR